jgi:hypothetical protein
MSNNCDKFRKEIKGAREAKKGIPERRFLAMNSVDDIGTGIIRLFRGKDRAMLSNLVRNRQDFEETPEE